MDRPGDEPNNAMAAVLKIAEDLWIGTSPAITTKTRSCRGGCDLRLRWSVVPARKASGVTRVFFLISFRAYQNGALITRNGHHQKRNGRRRLEAHRSGRPRKVGDPRA